MAHPEQFYLDELQHDRPACSKCGMQTQLARIEPSGEPDYDVRTFECVTCGNSDAVKVKFR
jgi:ribosomal protein L37E